MKPTSAPTLDEIRTWPAAISVEEAARALRVSRSALYARIAEGNAPVETIEMGRSVRVVTASLVARLEGRAARSETR